MISVDFNDTNLHVGDTLRIHNKVIEGNKERIQIFEGILISLSGRGENKMMTLRHIGPLGIGVERKWPIDSKSIVKIEVKKKTSGVRRSKLYYLRGLTGRQLARI